MQQTLTHPPIKEGLAGQEDAFIEKACPARTLLLDSLIRLFTFCFAHDLPRPGV